MAGLAIKTEMSAIAPSATFLQFAWAMAGRGTTITGLLRWSSMLMGLSFALASRLVLLVITAAAGLPLLAEADRAARGRRQ